jgi:hypothetical protein
MIVLRSCASYTPPDVHSIPSLSLCFSHPRFGLSERFSRVPDRSLPQNVYICFSRKKKNTATRVRELPCAPPVPPPLPPPARVLQSKFAREFRSSQLVLRVTYRLWTLPFVFSRASNIPLRARRVCKYVS